MEKNSEEILISALKLFEQNKSKEEIFDLFPDQRKEINELLETAQLLQTLRAGIIPPKETLREILNQHHQKALSQESILPRHKLLKTLLPLGALTLIVLVAFSVIQTAMSPSLPVLGENSLRLSEIQKEAGALDFDPELYKIISVKTSPKESFGDEISEIEELESRIKDGRAPLPAAKSSGAISARTMIIIELLREYETEKIGAAEARHKKISLSLEELKIAGKNVSDLEKLSAEAGFQIAEAKSQIKLAESKTNDIDFIEFLEKIKNNLKNAYKTFEDMAILAKSI